MRKLPAETAYLDELQQRGSTIQIADPSGEVKTGHDICAILGDFKPEQRTVSAYLLQQHGYNRVNITAATAHLCPELGV